MNKSQVILLKLLANKLFDKNYHISELTAEEWKSVFEEAKQQAVLRLAYLAAEKYDVPQDILLEYQKTSHYILKNNIQVVMNHKFLHEWFTNARIPYVILKGCSSAYYYPSSIDRAMGDVDFYVRKADLERAGNVLKEQGLEPWEVDHICHIVYRKPGMHYEMHFDLSGVPYGKPGELVHEYIKDIIEESFVSDENDVQICLPSKFHHGLIILLHTSHHLTGEGIGLRHLCDWAVFLESCTDDEFKELFEDKFNAIGMWKFASVLSQICIKYLGCKPKDCLMDIDENLSVKLLDDILFGGNFGNKEKNRSTEGLLISDRGKDGIKSNYSIIHGINNTVYKKWTITKKIPILLPFGWIYFGARFVIRSVISKHINPFMLFKATHNRNDLYSRLGIFEISD